MAKVPLIEPNIIQNKANASLNSILSFLSKIQGNKEAINTVFQKEDGLYSNINLQTFVPMPEHAGLWITFKSVPAGGGSSYMVNSDGSYRIILNISWPLALKRALKDPANRHRGIEEVWNDEFITHIKEWFWNKKRRYVDEFERFLRNKYYSQGPGSLGIKGGPPVATGNKKNKSDKDLNADELTHYYNAPDEVESQLKRARQQVRNRIAIGTPGALRGEFGRNWFETLSALNFIKTVFNKYLDKDFTKYLSVGNRHKIFEDLYNFYIEIKEELMNAKKSDKVKKLSVAELREMIQVELDSALLEALDKQTPYKKGKGTPEWKDVADTVKKKEWVPAEAPKKTASLEQTPLRDLMGLGGEKVLVKPLDKEKAVPVEDKGDDKTQLEQKEEESAVTESVEEELYEGANPLKQNAWLCFNASDTDDDTRF